MACHREHMMSSQYDKSKVSRRVREVLISPMRNIVAQGKTGESHQAQSHSTLSHVGKRLVADLVGIVAVDLPELLHRPLGPSNKGEGVPEFLQLCNEELTWPFFGHCMQMKKTDLEVNFKAHTSILYQSSLFKYHV